MSSYRKLAIAVRAEEGIYNNIERNRFLPAVFEIAHALSRGRKPTSCSVLPGENLQTWLRHVFIDITPDCYDYAGEECSIADDVVGFQCWGNQLHQAQSILQAIEKCQRYLRPLKKDSEDRGDFQYQNTHRVTNLKKKRAWLHNKNGSCYDDMYDNYKSWGFDRAMAAMNEAMENGESLANVEVTSAPSSPVKRVRSVRRISP